MISLAEVLAWKYDAAHGIRTQEKSDGTMEIFDWPVDALGPAPTAENLQKWTAEYEPEWNVAQVNAQRKTAYQMESDGLFFKEQAGELDSGVWQAKRNEIKTRFPKEE